MRLAHSFNENIDKVHSKAEQVEYPYLLVLGEKDVYVDNSMTRSWHSRTHSKTKDIKLLAGSYHELSKEPNNH